MEKEVRKVKGKGTLSFRVNLCGRVIKRKVVKGNMRNRTHNSEKSKIFLS